MTRHLGALLLALILVYWPAHPVRADQSDQQVFTSPQQGFDALASAVRAGARKELLRILGPAGAKLVYSGDRVADRNGRARFIAAYDSAHRITSEDDDKATLVIGKEDWAYPIPLVKDGDAWRFDTEAGAQRILDRRIGRNELNVIEVCRAYVEAQREYAERARKPGEPAVYARKFVSDTGQHNGLYWKAGAGEEASPLGPLFANARAEGYESDHPVGRRSPYHGYYYRILHRQGEHAPGGARDYVVDGRMTGGFALLAYPAKWGDSGVMTFVVNQTGIVFQKNLGPDTAEAVKAISEYDPDPSWQTP